MGHISTAAVGQTRYWWIAQSAGEVLASWDTSGLPDDLEVVGKHFDASPEESIDWRRTLKSSDEMFPASKRVGIPYYQIVAGYLALWAGLLFWRNRKFEKRPVG
jgi:hypothetical protein